MALVVYRNVEQMFVMDEADENEFIARYFEGVEPSEEEWDRYMPSGPIEIERPEVPDFQEVYDSYEV